MSTMSHTPAQRKAWHAYGRHTPAWSKKGFFYGDWKAVREQRRRYQEELAFLREKFVPTTPGQGEEGVDG